MSTNLIIVSNRLPVSVKKVAGGKLQFFPSVGGLATGLSSYTKNKNNKWIGWPGIARNDLSESERQQISEELAKSNCYPVFLTQSQLNDYYNGYSNSILWPLFHDIPLGQSAQDQSKKYWSAYQNANDMFLDALLALTDDTSRVWIHDYQLMTLPAMLRERRPNQSIGFFLHIPFPTDKDFLSLPNGRDLAMGLLGADLIGFHTQSYLGNFLDVLSLYGLGIVSGNQVSYGSRIIKVSDFPIGIDYAKYIQAAKIPAVLKESVRLKTKYRGKKVILTVDRLDPSKGLVERARAYQTLLLESPKLRGKVVLVMLAVPSRTEIEEYKKLKVELEKLIKDINKEFGTAKWKPVEYLYKSLPFEKLNALYRRADIAFIVPLRDGMNLVAKEYLASKPRKNGVLILSKTAGAAEELKDAVLVDPHNPKSVVKGLNKALSMQKIDLQKRVTKMQKQISDVTIHSWAKGFTKTLQFASLPVGTSKTKLINKKNLMDISLGFSGSENRLLLLDYDGVLVPFENDYKSTSPPASVKKLLGTLAQMSDVAIVSGRSKNDLDKWLSDLPITLVAEHGSFLRSKESNTWHEQNLVAPGWQPHVLAQLQKYTDRTPGAVIEQKTASIVWHYRDAAPYYAHKHLVALKRVLVPLAKIWDLDIWQGNMILEVRPRGSTKGNATHNLIEEKSYDFILAMGDDYTDEDMFASLPEDAYTIKIGRGRTLAKYRLNNQPDVVGILKKLSNS